MGKVTQTVVECTCDRCGKVGNTGIMEGRNVWGELDIAYSGHQGSRSWDGSAGGINIKGRKWLCMSCTEDFLKFMDNH